MNFVFIGEAGSGKTEIALNTAAMLAEKRDKKIILIDLDQTKAIFRLREKAEAIESDITSVKWGQQLLDTPITPSGIKEAIEDDSHYCIIDVGGNAAGAIQLGQFSQALRENESEIYYCINPYRPFTKGEELAVRIAKVKKAAGVEEVAFICNPNLGADTKAGDILEGISEMENNLSEIEGAYKIEKVAVTEQYYEELKESIYYDTIKLKRYIVM